MDDPSLFESFVLKYNEFKAQEKAYAEQAKELREECAPNILMWLSQNEGKPYRCNAGTIVYSKAGTRTSWKTEVIESVIGKLVNIDVELAAELASAREQTFVAENFKVR